MRSLVALREVARNRSLLLLEVGWTSALAAEGAYLVSILVYAYEVGGIAAVGLVTTLRALPAAFVAPLLAVVADRLPRARVLLGIHLTRAAVVGLAAFASSGQLSFGVALVAVVVEGLLVGLHRATTLALMPALARAPEELVAGNGAVSFGEAVGVLVGPLVAGLLLAVGGPALGMIAAAGGHLAAGGHRRWHSGRPAAHRKWPGGRGPLGAGRYAGRPGLAVAVPARGWGRCSVRGQTLVRGVLTVAIVVAAVELLDVGESGVGYLTSAIGAGGLVGATFAMILVGQGSLARTFAISLAAWGAPVALLGIVPDSRIAFVLLAVVGAANATLDVSGYTLLQRSVPNEVRARAFGALEAVVGLGMAAGAALAPFLVGAAGLPAALVLSGLLLPALAVAAYPRLRHVEAHAVVPRRELALLRRRLDVRPAIADQHRAPRDEHGPCTPRRRRSNHRAG